MEFKCLDLIFKVDLITALFDFEPIVTLSLDNYGVLAICSTSSVILLSIISLLKDANKPKIPFLKGMTRGLRLAKQMPDAKRRSLGTFLNVARLLGNI